jgi:hypothetical protein
VIFSTNLVVFEYAGFHSDARKLLDQSFVDYLKCPSFSVDTPPIIKDVSNTPLSFDPKVS